METFFIELLEEDLKKLHQNIWENIYVQGKLTMNNESFQIKIGFRGNQLRKHKKKSYHIIFEKPYFFRGQHELHLNAEYNDPSLIRNKLSFHFFQNIGVLAPNAQHILLNINGRIKDIYLCLESFDQYYLKNRTLQEGSIYYATNDDANFSLYTPEGYIKKTLLDGYTIKHTYQSEEHLKKLLVLINTYSKDQFKEEIEKILHVEKYLRWLVGVVCTQNFDGFIHNYALYHNSLTNRFEISPWDYDGTWGRNLHGIEMEHTVVPITGYNTLTARLLEYEKYKKMYQKLLIHILENQFTPQNIEPTIEHIQSELLPYIEEKKRKSFLSEKQYILHFIKKRRHFLLNKLSLIS